MKHSTQLKCFTCAGIHANLPVTAPGLHCPTCLIRLPQTLSTSCSSCSPLSKTTALARLRTWCAAQILSCTTCLTRLLQLLFPQNPLRTILMTNRPGVAYGAQLCILCHPRYLPRLPLVKAIHVTLYSALVFEDLTETLQ